VDTTREKSVSGIAISDYSFSNLSDTSRKSLKASEDRIKALQELTQSKDYVLRNTAMKQIANEHRVLNRLIETEGAYSSTHSNIEKITRDDLVFSLFQDRCQRGEPCFELDNILALEESEIDYGVKSTVRKAVNRRLKQVVLDMISADIVDEIMGEEYSSNLLEVRLNERYIDLLCICLGCSIDFVENDNVMYVGTPTIPIVIDGELIPLTHYIYNIESKKTIVSAIPFNQVHDEDES